MRLWQIGLLPSGHQAQEVRLRMVRPSNCPNCGNYISQVQHLSADVVSCHFHHVHLSQWGFGDGTHAASRCDLQNSLAHESSDQAVNGRETRAFPGHGGNRRSLSQWPKNGYFGDCGTGWTNQRKTGSRTKRSKSGRAYHRQGRTGVTVNQR